MADDGEMELERRKRFLHSCGLALLSFYEEMFFRRRFHSYRSDRFSSSVLWGFWFGHDTPKGCSFDYSKPRADAFTIFQIQYSGG